MIPDRDIGQAPDLPSAKRCTKCGEVKARSEFFASRSRPDGLQCHCKACLRAYQRSEKGKACRRAYQQSEKGKACRRAYRQSEKVKVYHRAYRQSEKVKVYRRAYRQSEKVKVYRRSEKRKAAQRAISQRDRTSVSDSYCKDLLKKQGARTEAISPELIKLKRAVVLTRRVSRQLKEKIHETQQDTD